MAEETEEAVLEAAVVESEVGAWRENFLRVSLGSDGSSFISQLLAAQQVCAAWLAWMRHGLRGLRGCVTAASRLRHGCAVAVETPRNPGHEPRAETSGNRRPHARSDVCSPAPPSRKASTHADRGSRARIIVIPGARSLPPPPPFA